MGPPRPRRPLAFVQPCPMGVAPLSIVESVATRLQLLVVCCLDAAAGGTDDYVKSVVGVEYAFVAELRGNDFVIDKREIQSSFEEMWSGIVAMCDTIAAIEG